MAKFLDYKGGHIYHQKGGTCTLFSLANAREYLHGIVTPEEEIYRLWDEWMDGKDGAPLIGIIGKCIQEGWFSSRKIVFDKSDIHPGDKIRAVSAVRDAIADPDKTVVMSIRTFKGEGIYLTRYNTISRASVDQRGQHAVHIPSFFEPEKRYTNYLTLENSWGKDWGKDGVAGLPINRMWYHVEEIIILSK